MSKLLPIEGTRFSDDVDLVFNLFHAINQKTDGHCPCIPKHMRDEDTICPCKKFRETRNCHCGLFVKVGDKDEQRNADE